MKTTHIILILILSLFILNPSQAQDSRANNWLFGDHSSITFDTYPPSSTFKTPMFQREGVSSISDDNGKLLFYTNGQEVWNKNDTIMKNGSGLLGHTSSSQSSMIVPLPNNPNIFYIFTQDAMESNRYGMNYNVVDLTKDKGLGEITVKNTNLLTNQESTEKLSSIYSKDRNTSYVITKQLYSKNYLVYSLSNPTDLTPKIYTGKMVSFNTGSKLGMIKFFSGGTKFASTFYIEGVLEYGDFDPSTGNVSNIDTMNLSSGIYGIEYSPDGKYIYVSNVGSPSTIIQVDTKTKTYVTISSISGLNDEVYGGLQLGIDGVIYATKYYSNYLNAILTPNNYFNSCNFTKDFVKLKDSTFGIFGLPNLPQTMYYKVGINKDQTVCEGNTIRLNVWTDTQITDTTTQYEWRDPSNNIISNKSYININNIQQSQEGIYTCKIDNKTGIFNLKTKVSLFPHLFITFKEHDGDTLYICDSNYYDINPTPSTNIQSFNISWDDGSTTLGRRINKSGTYKLTYSDIYGCITNNFTITIIFLPQIDPTIILKQLTFCPTPTYRLEVNKYNNVNYEWKFNDKILSTTHYIDIDSNGIYSVTIDNGYCVYNDTIQIKQIQPQVPNILIDNDLTVCDEDSIILSINPLINPNLYDILWNTGDTTKSLTLSNITQLIKIKLINKVNGCIYEDSIFVDVHNYKSIYPFDTTSIEIVKYFDEPFEPVFIPNNQNSYLIKDKDFRIFKDSITFISNDKYGIFIDTLVYKVNIDKCSITYYKVIQVTNIGIINVELQTPDRVDIGDTTCIVIRNKSKLSMNLDSVDLKLYLNYDKNALFKIDTNEYYRLGDGVCFIILLSKIKDVVLSIDSFEINNDYIEVNVKNAKVDINDICIRPLRQVKINLPSTLSVNPTPSTNDVIKIHYNTNSYNTNFLLYNNDGSLVWNDTLSNEDGLYIQNDILINTQDLSNGVYLLITFFDKKIITTKIIIQK